jgi:hypothetical protein
MSLNWNELIPSMFADARFKQTAGRRWQACIDGAHSGTVVAWRPLGRENFALNQADYDLALKFKRDGKLAEAFVVLATSAGDIAYVAHRDAEELQEKLKSVPARNGPHGSYWLLREDFSLLDDISAMIISGF